MKVQSAVIRDGYLPERMIQRDLGVITFYKSSKQFGLIVALAALPENDSVNNIIY